MISLGDEGCGITVETDKARDIINKFLESLKGKYIAGEKTLKLIVSGIIAHQHILILGPPGVGKTYLARTISSLIGGTFKRIQGNPDILPSDITGFNVHLIGGESRFIPGPIFANIVMIDEINRISTRALAALLEAMQERVVTVDGKTLNLPDPNVIIATMVPQSEGTYPLPEILLDRFGLNLEIKPLEPAREAYLIEKLYEIVYTPPVPIMTLREWKEVYNLIDKKVFVHEKVRNYIINLIHSLRKDNRVRYGPSTRSTINLYHLAKVYAFINGRDYVIPDDVKELIRNVVEHRIFLKSSTITEGITSRDLINEVLAKTEVPKY